MAWKPDPSASAIDAFTTDWANHDPIQPDWEGPSKNSSLSGHCNCCCSPMELSVLVSKVAENASPSSRPNTSNAKYFDIATRPSSCSPTLPKVGTDWLSAVRQMLMAQGIQGEPMEIILNSWREGTKKQYTTFISQWAQHCRKNNVDQTKPFLVQIFGFLAKLSSTLEYSAVATAKSTLSSLIQLDRMKLGDHPLVTRFMTGLFNKKSALPRYVEI